MYLKEWYNSIILLLSNKKVVVSITEKDNVILFPKTVEYYQVQLTRMLETEQYSEAIELLKFLLQCHKDDAQTYEEWKVLLEWLETQFSTLSRDKENDDETETELLERHVKSKSHEDQLYTKKLLDMLLQDTSLDKKFLALDQLVFIEHPQINETLKRWVENVDLHPLVQFKVLQTLKLRDVVGEVHMQRGGEKVSLLIEETPLTYNEYPPPICEIMERVQQISEVNHPALAYFAEQTWKAFLSYIYGTAMYWKIVDQDKASIDVWAAALHYISIETILGPVDTEETFQLYGITKELSFRWEQAHRFIKNFVESAFRPS
jgi:hypothetical protein